MELQVLQVSKTNYKGNFSMITAISSSDLRVLVIPVHPMPSPTQPYPALPSPTQPYPAPIFSPDDGDSILLTAHESTRRHNPEEHC
jgi:hypothetical protein